MSNQWDAMVDQHEKVVREERLNAQYAAQGKEDALLSHRVADLIGEQEEKTGQAVPDVLKNAVEARIRQDRSQSLFELVCQYINRFEAYRKDPKAIKRAEARAAKEGKPFELADQLEFPEFYNKAGLLPSAWSDLRKGIGVPSEKTIFMLALALELNEEEANRLMRKAGKEFRYGDPQHDLILKIIREHKPFDRHRVRCQIDAYLDGCKSMDEYFGNLYDTRDEKREHRRAFEQKLREAAQDRGEQPEGARRRSIAELAEERFSRLSTRAEGLDAILDKQNRQEAYEEVVKELNAEKDRITSRLDVLKERAEKKNTEIQYQWKQYLTNYNAEKSALFEIGNRIAKFLRTLKEKWNADRF